MNSIAWTFIRAFKNYELWWFLSYQEIVLRYRRSKLGPIWITLSMAIFIATLAVVFSQLFKMELQEYLPHLAISYVIWGFLSSTLGEAPSVFIESASFLKDIRINPIIFLIKSLTKNMIIFLHNFLIVFGIYFLFKLNPGLNFFIGLIGLFVVSLNLFFMSAILSIIGARYRDIVPITQSLIQVSFFVTPITWMPKLVDKDSVILLLNPFSHFLNITRSPFLGYQTELLSWIISFSILIFLATTVFYLYKSKMKSIVFWI